MSHLQTSYSYGAARQITRFQSHERIPRAGNLKARLFLPQIPYFYGLPVIKSSISAPSRTAENTGCNHVLWRHKCYCAGDRPTYPPGRYRSYEEQALPAEDDTSDKRAFLTPKRIVVRGVSDFRQRRFGEQGKMGEKKYCWRCGAVNWLSARYCVSCGTSFEEKDITSDVGNSDVTTEDEDSSKESDKNSLVSPETNQRLAEEAKLHVERMRESGPRQTTLHEPTDTVNYPPSKRQKSRWEIVSIIMGCVVLIGVIVLILIIGNALESAESSDSTAQNSSQPSEEQHPLVDSLMQECAGYSSDRFLLSRSEDGSLAVASFYSDQMNNLSLMGCIAQQVGGVNSAQGAMKMAIDFIKLAGSNLMTSADQISNVEWSNYNSTAAIRCGTFLSSENIIYCEITEPATAGLSSDDLSNLESNDSSGTKAPDEAQADISYPPYPGNITAEEYNQYFKDLTTETHIQTVHGGMVQIMDCIPTGVATDGSLPLRASGGVIAKEVQGTWVPDPKNGNYCVTRQPDTSGDFAVVAYETFVRLSREEIYMDYQEKSQMLYQYGQ